MTQIPPNGASGENPVPAVSYADITSKVWEMYERLRLIETPSGRTRNVLMPPPPRGRAVDLLVVGISPNNNAPIGYGKTKEEAEEFARKFEYVAAAPGVDSLLAYNSYYRPLLFLASKIHKNADTWKQIENTTDLFLVEFTDFLHIATEPGGPDLSQLINNLAPNDPVRAQCLEILQLEIALHQPRAIFCNGQPPSDALFKLCSGHRMGFNPPVATHLVRTKLGCSVHFATFYRDDQIDSFSQLRLVDEIRQNLPKIRPCSVVPSIDRVFALLQNEGALMQGCFKSSLSTLRSVRSGERGPFYAIFFNYAIGLERLLKILLVLDTWNQKRKFPTDEELKGYSHKLGAIYATITKLFPRYDLVHPTGWEQDPINRDILTFLTDYATGSRYYNLDTLAGASKSLDPAQRWETVLYRIYAKDVPKKEPSEITHGYTPPHPEPSVHHTIIVAATPYICWRLVELLIPLKALLVAVREQAHQNDTTQSGNTWDTFVPWMEEFLDFVCNDREVVMHSKDWLD